MAEFFQNKFVIKIESGHPGYRQYTIIATRENMARMVQELSQALAEAEESQLSNPQASTGLSQLWSQYATIAYGETSRITLTFALSPELDVFHARPKRSRDLLFCFGCLGLTAILILAYIGLKAIAHGSVP